MYISHLELHPCNFPYFLYIVEFWRGNECLFLSARFFESCHISLSLFPDITISSFLLPRHDFPLHGSGCEATSGSLKICKAASRPPGFGENLSIRPAGRLKIFHQKPCIFSPRPYLPPETSKVKPPTRHKKKSML